MSEGTQDRDQPGREKGGRGRLIGRTKGGMNTKLHAICDSQRRPLDLFVTAGQISDYTDAGALLGGLPKVDWLLGDRGHDADWFREALKDIGIRACMPDRKQRRMIATYDKRRYKRRNRIEIMFGRLRIGDAGRRDTTGAQRSSSPQSLSPQPSSIGYES